MATKALPGGVVTADDASIQSWAEALVARAKADEVELVGTNGLLTALMGTVLQTGMEIELTTSWLSGAMDANVLSLYAILPMCW